MFGKEQDLIKRIMNLILIIWIIVAIFIAYSSLINLFFDHPKDTYKEYEKKYCLEEVNLCKNRYDVYLLDKKREQKEQTKVLINSLGNIVIIGTFMLILNKKQ